VVQLILARCQKRTTDLSQGLQLVIGDVVALVLGEPI
jgi:hypothetical protein